MPLTICSSGYQEGDEDEEESDDDDEDEDNDGDMFPSDDKQEKGASFQHFSKDDSSSDAQKGASVKNQLCKNLKIFIQTDSNCNIFSNFSGLGQSTRVSNPNAENSKMCQSDANS